MLASGGGYKKNDVPELEFLKTCRRLWAARPTVALIDWVNNPMVEWMSLPDLEP